MLSNFGERVRADAVPSALSGARSGVPLVEDLDEEPDGLVGLVGLIGLVGLVPPSGSSRLDFVATGFVFLYFPGSRLTLDGCSIETFRDHTTVYTTYM